MSYPKCYGAWAGNPKGVAPDFSRCCQEVWPRGTMRGSQCSRPRQGDSPYCKMHDPLKAQARREKGAERGREKMRRRRMEISGPSFYNVLLKIANGHEDPRALAREVLREFDK